jgi:hypothetical protein
MLPPLSVMVLLPPDPLQLLLSRLTSNPDGTVAITLAIRFEPDTVILVGDEAVPLVVLNAESDPLGVIVGVAVVTLLGLLVPVAVA